MQTAERYGRAAVSRRRLLALLGGAAGAAILAACGDEAAPAPTATTAPRPTTAPSTAAGGTTGGTTGAASAVATTAPSAVTTAGGASAVAPTATRAASAVTGTTTTGAASAVAATTAPTTAATTGAASAAVATPTRAASAVTGTTTGSAVAGTTTTTSGSAVAGTTMAGGAAMNVLPTLDIESFDYGYRTVLGAVPGGWTLVRQRNTGKEVHHVQFIRLRDGVTQPQLLAAVMGQNAEAAIAMLTTNVGGPGAVDPGGVSEAIINLQAGSHFLVCYVPSPDGTPHLAKGMVLPLQVTPGPTAAARLPETVGTVTMNDFVFQMPVSTVKPGRSYWTVTNAGKQPHEFIVVKLQPGKTAADVTAFYNRPMGPPPFSFVGGMQGLENGGSGIASLDLTAGAHVAICQIPDPMSGKAHVLLGMIAGLTVQ